MPNIKEILFFKDSYEVEIEEGGKKFWPFLHIDDNGKLLDYFCSCPGSEKKGCKHIKAAYMRISDPIPLHVKFEKSLWNSLCFVIGKKNKFKMIDLKPITDSAKEKVKEILQDKSSTKMSLLSEEDKVNKELLAYKLSSWFDLAQYLFLLQDEGKSYRVEFLFDETGFPNGLSIFFEDIELSFNLAKEELSKIVFSLDSIKSPLKVYKDEDLIEKISYNVQKSSFSIESKEALIGEAKQKGRPFEKWLFVEKKGFYPLNQDSLFEQREICAISQYLDKYSPLFKKLLSNVSIEDSPTKVKYLLFFDGVLNLHIKSFLFDKNDLSKRNSRLFDNWAFIEEKGFFRIKDNLFKSKEKTIPKEEISSFVSNNREWLMNFKGFRPHFSPLESKLAYSFTNEGDLKFELKLQSLEGIVFFDFEDWVYVENEGFYTKKEMAKTLPFYPNQVVEKKALAQFISTYREDLRQIDGFFTDKEFIESIGLAITINEEGNIEVNPEIKALCPLNILHFFANFVYVEKVGFFELTPNLRLPMEYRQKKLIPKFKEESFLAYELKRLRPYTTFLDKRLEAPKELTLEIVKISKKAPNYFVEFFYKSEKGKVSPEQIWQAMKKKASFIFSDAGLLFLKDLRFNWIKNLKRKNFLEKRLKLSALEWIKICLFEDIEIAKEASIETKTLLTELYSFKVDEFIDISNLQSKLRPYQEIGLKWLWFLYVHGLSGLLCDEMGLGKTHQAMSLIAATIKKEKGLKYLIICPTSVIYHWQELLNNNLKDITVSVYYGLDRNLEKFISTEDILLTSYGTLRSDIAKIKQINFEVAIFDEIQVAKNYISQTHKVLKSISAKMKLGLSGTPIENNLRELKSLFDIVLPNYLPQDSLFKEHFLIPIEKHFDEGKQALLTRLIKPFILRRKKSEVLKDLPEKIEEIVHSDMSDEQRELYRTTFLQEKHFLFEELKSSLPYIHIFALLTKLKRICDHPSLILGDIENYEQHKAGKWELFKELLQETRDSNQKLVIFSQYLDMLSIIEIFLHKQNIGFASITGATKDRREQIKKFKEDPNCEVFVASLLAGGLGIDLSSASVVIHYDRWWNPAKENQATDRVHRFGQKRGVQVFKLVTKNSVEEHIDKLIEKKKNLLEKTIGKDESDQIKVLNREEILQVLNKISEDIIS